MRDYTDLDIAEDMLAELEDSHRSETALFGDSAPGMRDMIDIAFAAVVRIRRELGLPARRVARWNSAAQRSYFLWVDEEGNTAAQPETDDLPF